MEKYIGRKEAAERIGISVSSVDNLIKSGALPATRPSGKKRGRVVIAESALQDYLARNTTISPSPQPTAPN